jgi:hypothetical protein
MIATTKNLKPYFKSDKLLEKVTEYESMDKSTNVYSKAVDGLCDHEPIDVGDEDHQFWFCFKCGRDIVSHEAEVDYEERWG